MVKKIIHPWIDLFSSVFAGVTFYFCFKLQDQINEPMLWTALCLCMPLLAGYLGVLLGNAIDKKRKCFFPSTHPLRFVLCYVLVFVLGMGGQALYSLSWEEEETSGNVQVVLLMDGSDSMTPYKENCQNAAIEIIESLDEHYELKVVSFASLILGQTDSLVMDEAGKEEVINFIENMDTVGGTNFDFPLDLAASELSAKENPAVIMLTDGVAPIAEATRDPYENELIPLYTIRIGDGSADPSLVADLQNLSINSGGFDVEVDSSDGSIDEDELLDAFDDAFSSTGGMVMLDRYLLEDKPPQPVMLYILLRAVVLGLVAIITGYLYFGKQEKKHLGMNFCMGLLMAVLISIVALKPIELAILMTVVIYGCYASLREADEDV